jgi:metal-responsive CopG/Arc/MetJ family transcriptional regulator
MASKKKIDEWFEFIGIKFPKSLVKAMDRYIARDTHATRSEFIRTAVREKVQKDMPDVWADVMLELKEEEQHLKEEAQN